MFTKNGNILKINGDWLKPKPIWNTISELNYSNLTTYSRTNMATNAGKVGTYDPGGVGSYFNGNIVLYKTIQIPSDKLNDDYLLFEINLRPYRKANKTDYIMCGTSNYFAINVRKSSTIITNEYDIASYSLPEEAVYKWSPPGGEYITGTWNHKLYKYIPNYTLLNDISIDESDLINFKLRILYNLNNNSYYTQIGINLSEDIILSNFYYCGELPNGMGTSNYYTICFSISSIGYGNWSDYMNSGYDCAYGPDYNEGYSIKLKSFKGTL